MHIQFQPGEEVIWQGTLKAEVVRMLANGNVIIAFGTRASKVVSPLELSRDRPVRRMDDRLARRPVNRDNDE